MPLDPENQPPLPPRNIPPAPPPQALLKPTIPHVPLTPMMDFLQRRLEALEKELDVERERARAAQALMQQQESLRVQVEDHLKSMADNLRREKAEKEKDETNQHARGRIDALEKRLDEMHQSWVTLLRDAMSQRESTHREVTGSQDTIAREQAAMRQEMTALQGSIDSVLKAMSQWRAETRPIADAAPALKAFEGQISQRLDHMTAEFRDRVNQWERKQQLEQERHEERVQAFMRERAALMREMEERDHAIRHETLKEKLHREQMLGEQIGELTKQLEALRASEAASRAELTKVFQHVTKEPAARDKIIESLELEKKELMNALKDRSETLAAHIQQRRDIERSMGESLMAANKELDELKGRIQLLSARMGELELDKARLADELAGERRLNAEKDERRAVLERERDALAKAMLAEAEKARALIDERGRSDEGWSTRLQELQAKLAAEIEARTREGNAVAELRGQIATLSEHLARALQERDLASSRHGGWESEKAELQKRLKEKEEMISMLNSTFQKFLK